MPAVSPSVFRKSSSLWRKLISCLGLFLLFTMARGQDTSIVHWEFLGSKSADTGAVLHLVAHIQPGWKLYSTTMPEDLPNSRIRLDGGTIRSISESGERVQQKDPLFDQAEVRYFENRVSIDVTVSADLHQTLRGRIDYMAARNDSIIGPDSLRFHFQLDATGALVGGSSDLAESQTASQSLRRTSIDLANPVNSCGGTGTEDSASKGLLHIFILGFLGGLIALLTPCVFPMIPLTVSFFTKQTHNRKKGIANALLYGACIFLIYTLLSVPFYFLDSLNPEILNNISTNVWLNLFFFIVFIVFALSFFGLFEITLPSSLSNRVDAKAGSKSFLGIFFMALTLALVSFSCTGPILGSLLAGSLTSNGGAVQLTAGMTGFGLALALPFALFALFPNWLHSLPKSGGWLTTVKMVLGFLELALAIKFLSNADLVQHWGLLKREIFLGAWVVIGILLVLYLFGIIKFQHAPPPAKLSWGRRGVGLLFLAFTIYLVPGLFNSPYANRSLVSGFPPPLSYSLYGDELVKKCGVEARVHNDYEQALKLARAENKPLLIDFTGWACVNCRKMEENVWTDPRVKSLIQQHFILVSLYVDDRQPLEESHQFLFTTHDGYKKAIRTIGDQYATLQSENFANASQPLYAVISPGERLLTRPVGYTPDKAEYAAWLQCALDAYSRAQK